MRASHANSVDEKAAAIMGAALENKSATGLSGARRVAILCIVLGDELAGEILQRLEEEEVQMVSKELAAIQYVPPELAETVIKEFYELFVGQSLGAAAGMEFAKRLLIKALGPEGAKRMLDRITRSVEEAISFDTLKKVSPQQLAKILQSEHPQTISLILAHLDASTAADALGHLPEGQRSEVLMRMAFLQTLSQDVIRRVLLALDRKLKSIGDFSQQVGGVRTAAELCNRLDRETSRKTLEEIEAVNPDLALAIRNLMVTFDDLLLVDDVGIREILKFVEKKVIATALKGSLPEIQARFFTNMSAKAVEMMKEEMEFMGQIKVKDVSAAQREIVNVLRDLDERGVISLAGTEDAYVA